MKVEAQPRDAEVLVKDYLQGVMFDVDCTISVGVPADWTPTSTPHLEVASDGAPTNDWPICVYETIRLVARADSRSEAKELCGRGVGWLLAQEEFPTRLLTGVLPERDPQTHAELASATVRVTVRTEPLASGS